MFYVLMEVLVRAAPGPLPRALVKNLRLAIALLLLAGLAVAAALGHRAGGLLTLTVVILAWALLRPAAFRCAVSSRLGRLVVGITLLGSLLGLRPEPSPTSGADGALATGLALAALAVYGLFVHLLERRSPSELAPTRALPELPAGLALGLVMSVVPALHGVASAEPGEASSAGFLLALALFAGVIEELLFRGVVLRISEEALGTFLALALSAAAFSWLHRSGIRLDTLLAGLALGSLYVVTRRLWLPIGGHVGHNALLDLLSGGAGAELESLAGQPAWQAAVHLGVLALLSLVCLAVASRRGTLRRSAWRIHRRH